ncbi:MAG: hypothetical protein U0694_23905 [Anaerolineae bacterium]
MNIRKSTVLFLLVFLAVGILTVYAGLSFIGGGSVTLGSIDGTVQIAGFGNRTQSVTVDMTVVGSNLVASCVNRGGNRAPGQNPVNVNTTVNSGAVYPARNGTATIQMTVNILPTAAEAGCPNNNWRVTDLLGTIFVTFRGTDTSQTPPVVITQTLVCQVNEPMRTVTCAPQ